MGYGNREIELKLQVMSGKTLSRVRDLVEQFVIAKYPEYDPEDDFIVGDASDLYWHAPAESIGDFVRLRQKTGGAGQITMKAKDRGSQLNRIEIDLEVDHKQAKVLMLGLFNESVERVRKRYYVFRLGDEHKTVSVYKIRGDDRVFIENEAKTEKEVYDMTNAMSDYTGLSLSVVHGSIYDIFVKKTNPVLTPLIRYPSNDK